MRYRVNFIILPNLVINFSRMHIKTVLSGPKLFYDYLLFFLSIFCLFCFSVICIFSESSYFWCIFDSIFKWPSGHSFVDFKQTNE